MPKESRRTFLKVSGAVLGGFAAGTTVTAATSTDRFLVDKRKLNGSVGDLEVVHDVDEIDLLVVEGSESAVQSLGVDYAEDTLYSLDLPVDGTPVADAEDATDEPLFGLQWDKQVQDVASAHEVTRGEGTRVAVIDSGIGFRHPDHAGSVNVALSRNFTPDDLGAPGPWGGDHGSHVAGIVGASDRNDVGVVGTAPGAELVDCRVFSSVAPSGSFGSVIAAIVHAAAVECDVANMSLGAYPVPRQGLGSFYGKVLNRAVNFANSQDTLLVGSAGNDATDLQHDGGVISLPNEAPNVMSISATGPIGFGWGDPGLRDPPTSPAFYTNFGTNAIDLSAPGGDADLDAIGTGVDWFLDLVLNVIAQPTFDDDGNPVSIDYGWGWIAGTSMSSPQVAGAAALVKSADPSLNANQVRQTLERTARDVGDEAFHGSGFVDPVAAVEDASQ